MVIPKEFKIPEAHNGSTFTAFEKDPKLHFEFNGRREDTYLAVGYSGLEGSRIGVLIHGTNEREGSEIWREEYQYIAPSINGIEVTSTEFHGAEFLENLQRRVCGCYETADDPGMKKGFLYEGPLDGSGYWYPIMIPGAETTVVKKTHGDILICRKEGGNDELHVLSLTDHTWKTFHTGFASDWTIRSVSPADGVVWIEGTHAGGQPLRVTYR